MLTILALLPLVGMAQDKPEEPPAAEPPKADMDDDVAPDEEDEDEDDDEEDIEIEGTNPAPIVSNDDEPPRNVVVVSDLQMGLGQLEDGSWHPKEEFRWTRAWAEFLNAVDTRSAGTPIDLIIAGDLLDLMQAPEGASCDGATCTDDQYKVVAEAIVKAHGNDLALIGEFSRKGHRVYVMPGSQDAALSNDDIWTVVRAAMEAPVDQEALAALAPPPPEPEPEPEPETPEEGSEEEAPTEEAPAEEAPAPAEGTEAPAEAPAEEPSANPCNPCAEPEPPKPVNIELATGVWATEDGQVVVEPWSNKRNAWAQAQINGLEGDLPLIDNLRPVDAGLLYVVGPDKVDDALRDPVALADVLESHAMVTAPGRPHKWLHDPKAEQDNPKWNLKKAAKRGHLLFVDTLHPDDPVRAGLLNGAEPQWQVLRGELAKRAKKLSDAELSAICDATAVHKGLYGKRGAYPRCDGPKGATTKIANGRAEVVKARLDAIRNRYSGMSLYVHASSHAPEFAWEVRMNEKGTDRVTVYNSGAFHRLADRHTFRAMTAKRLSINRSEVEGSQLKESMGSFDLRHLPACYTTVFIDYDEDLPDATLQHWYMPRKAEAGEFVSPCATQCGWSNEQCISR